MLLKLASSHPYPWSPVPLYLKSAQAQLQRRRGWGLFLGRSLYFFAHASCQGCEGKGEELQGTLQVGVGCRGRNGTFSKTMVMTQCGFGLFHLEHTRTFLVPSCTRGPQTRGRFQPWGAWSRDARASSCPGGQQCPPTSPIHRAN